MTSPQRKSKSGGDFSSPTAATANANSTTTNTTVSLDMKVGVHRLLWPKTVTCIITIERNTVCRYHKSENLLDIVQFSTTCDKSAVIAKLQLGSAVKLDDGVHSIHHFSLRQETHILCIGASKRHYGIVRVSGGNFFVSKESTPLPFGNDNDNVTSHVVTFMYRGTHYVLFYNSISGEYHIIGSAQLCQPAPSVASRGKFTPGWTDILWKGTHHIRCTRQRFFCYNCRNGDVAFECVYIQGGSQTSSICSREHLTMEAEREGKAGGAELKTSLKRKGCMAVPLTIANRTACLLYTHSQLKPGDLGGGGVSGASSSRLGASGSGSEQWSQRAAQGVINSTSLLLQKQIFQHSEPWTHFCMLSDNARAGGCLLSYSAVSGSIWVSTVFPCSNPERVITLVPDEEVAAEDSGEDGHQRPQQRNGRGGGGGAPASPRGSGGDGSCLSPRSRSKLTQDNVVKMGEDPVDVAQYAQSHPPTTDQARRKQTREEEVRKQEKERQEREKARKESSFAAPLPQRPSSSSHSIHRRLQVVQLAAGDDANASAADPNNNNDAGAAASSPAEYSACIAKVVRDIVALDFPPDSPVAKLVMRKQRKRLGLATEEDALEEERERAARGGAAGADDDDDEDDEDRDGDDESMMGGPLQLTPRPRSPWHNVSALRDRSEGKLHNDFCRKYTKHLVEDVSKPVSEAKVIERLTTVHFTREQFQEKELAVEQKKIMQNSPFARDHPLKPGEAPAPPVKVGEMVTRLAESDIEVRGKGLESLTKKYAFVPPKDKKLSDDDMQVQVQRLGIDGVRLHREAQATRERKAFASPKSRRLTSGQQKTLAQRLGEETIRKKEASVDRVFHKMNDGHQPRTVKLPATEAQNAAKRLFLNKTRDEFNSTL